MKKEDYLTEETKKHLIFILNGLRDIPQLDKYMDKLVNEQLDNIIYKLNKIGE